VPLQVLGGLHYLVLQGRASWEDVPAALVEHRDFLRRFVATQGVQTNEVQRCWMLLPCFLDAVRRAGTSRVALVELGTSAGLNLRWDAYGYRYGAGSWGDDAGLVLAGQERGAVPAELLEQRVDVRSRVGIDLAPPDLRSADAVLLLKAFVWPDQQWRLDQLDRAVEAWRADPPPIVAGDLVEELPRVLERVEDGVLPLVWETAVFGYLAKEQRAAARRTLESTGRRRPLAFVQTWLPLDGSHDNYGLYVQVWPGGERVEVGACDFHGAWLDWRAA
jgi:hypothetical protein